MVLPPEFFVNLNKEWSHDDKPKSKSGCVTFADLWANAETGNPAPELGNQCAARLSVTLHRVGVTMKTFSQRNPVLGKRIGRIIKDGLPVATRADEMARWLKTKPFCGLGNPENVTGADWKSKVRGRTGIIAFSQYWSRGGNDLSGGHIDLWNGYRFPYPSPSLSEHGTVGIVGNWSRFGLNGWGVYNGGYLFFSDLAASKVITFFEIK